MSKLSVFSFVMIVIVGVLVRLIEFKKTGLIILLIFTAHCLLLSIYDFVVERCKHKKRLAMIDQMYKS